MFLQEAPAGSLQLTGVLGLAALVWGLYQLRAPGRRDDNAGPQDLNNRRGPNSTGSLMQQPKQAQSSSTAQQVYSLFVLFHWLYLGLDKAETFRWVPTDQLPLVRGAAAMQVL